MTARPFSQASVILSIETYLVAPSRVIFSPKLLPPAISLKTAFNFSLISLIRQIKMADR